MRPFPVTTTIIKGCDTVTSKLLKKIEASRLRLHGAGFDNKEKLLRESRKLDLLIVKYHRSSRTGQDKQQ